MYRFSVAGWNAPALGQCTLLIGKGITAKTAGRAWRGICQYYPENIGKFIWGERGEHRRWRMKRPERVAAVGGQRSRPVGEATTGHRNRAKQRLPMIRCFFGYFLVSRQESTAAGRHCTEVNTRGTMILSLRRESIQRATGKLSRFPGPFTTNGGNTTKKQSTQIPVFPPLDSPV